MADLAELLERVKAATGPDRELDRAIAEAVGARKLQGPPFELWAWPDGKRFRFGSVYDGADFTASLDAALALVERVLPGADWRLQTAPDGRDGFWAVLIHLQITRTADGPTAPLALLAALLKALAAQDSVGSATLTRDA